MTHPNGPVLLAYDGSESSATAIAVAGGLLPGREALVCHVSTGVYQKTTTAGVHLAQAAGFHAQPLPVREGHTTRRTLLEAAESHQASLLVAGARGFSGPRRALLGSVSAGLVHHSHVPVLVVPGATRDEERAGPLLLCYDTSESAKRAIAIAGELLDPQPALVLHFWESWVAEAPAAALSGTIKGMATELDEIADEQSSELIDDGLELAEQAGFDATGLSERAVGPGWVAVRDAANGHNCAAIVLGSRGLTGLPAALGSVSTSVVHHSRRPVLIVPPEADESARSRRTRD